MVRDNRDPQHQEDNNDEVPDQEKISQEFFDELSNDEDLKDTPIVSEHELFFVYGITHEEYIKMMDRIAKGKDNRIHEFRDLPGRFKDLMNGWE
ncbi:MAG: hypothetical protein ACP5O1_00495 [Phycisphaerae bacterium]